MMQHIENIGCKNMMVGPPELPLARKNNHISKGKGQTAAFDLKGLFAASPSPVAHLWQVL